MLDAMGKDPATYTPNEKQAMRVANQVLMDRFGTTTMRWGNARSYLWLEVYHRELDKLEAAVST